MHINSWSSHQGNIVKAAFTRETPAIFKASQVFVNDSRMHWARYPSQDCDTLKREDMAIVNVDLVEIDGKKMGLSTVDGLPKGPQYHWKGAYFMGLAKEKNWWTANKLIEAEALINMLSFHIFPVFGMPPGNVRNGCAPLMDNQSVT